MSSQDSLIAGGGAVLALAALSWLTGSLTLGFALTSALAVTMIATMLLGSLLAKSAPESAAVAAVTLTQRFGSAADLNIRRTTEGVPLPRRARSDRRRGGPKCSET